MKVDVHDGYYYRILPLLTAKAAGVPPNYVMPFQRFGRLNGKGLCIYSWCQGPKLILMALGCRMAPKPLPATLPPLLAHRA